MIDFVTPCFVFDTDKLKNHVLNMKNVLGERAKICFAMKANQTLLPDLKNLVDCVEVCSPGEFRFCEKTKVDYKKIVLSGVFKEETDLDRIMGLCKTDCVYTVESLTQANLLKKLATKYNITIHVCLRLSCGNQFGMDETDLFKIIETRQDYPFDISGIQYYSGTQKKTEKIVSEIKKLKDFINILNEKFDFKTRRLEYGPALKINYFEAKEDAENQLLALKQSLNEIDESVEIVLETGRFLVASCGSYFTKIVDAKITEGNNYLIVDGGINHLNYYGQLMAMKIPYHEFHKTSPSGEKKNYTVCGSLCTSADVIIKNLPLDNAQIGDIIEFKNTGAYSVTEGIYMFLLRDMPRIYKIKNGKPSLERDFIKTDEIIF